MTTRNSMFTSGTLHDRLRRQLHEKIQAGQWRTGDRLPSERALAETYKVSVMTVRRALRDLVLEGVLVRRVPAGTFVADETRKPHVLGLATFGPQAVESPYFGTMVVGIQKAAREQAELRLLAPPRGTGLSDWLKQLAAAGDVDGLIIITADSVRHEDVAYLEVAGFPYVLLNRRIPGHAAWCAVLDDYGVGRRAVDYLYALGHRRMAHLAGPPSVITAADRLRGFLDGLYAHGLLDLPADRRPAVGNGAAGATRAIHLGDSSDADAPAVPPGALVHFGRFTYDVTSPAVDQHGYEGMRALLAHDPGITAVFAVSDSLAAGAFRALREVGKRVPEDVSLLCMTNRPTHTVAEPAFTSFDYANEDLGWQAVELLVEQLEGRGAHPADPPRPGARRRVVEPVLVERESCGPAPTRSALERSAGTRDAAGTAGVAGRACPVPGIPVAAPARTATEAIDQIALRGWRP
ncbi:MAG: GntR family transcriptional regulator [Chloroflexota bacterium]